MNDSEKPKLSDALVNKILKDPDFASALLGEDEAARKTALYGFLGDAFTKKQKEDALEHLNKVVDKDYLDKMAALRDLLDGPVEIPF